MSQQTAVGWLIEQLRQLAFNSNTHLGMGDVRVTQGYIDELEEQAKIMEKDNINKSFYDGYYKEELYDARKYYDDTYNSQDETRYLLSTEENKKRLSESIQQMKNNTGSKKQTIVAFLINELLQNRLLALRYDADNTFNEVIARANEMEEKQNSGNESWEEIEEEYSREQFPPFGGPFTDALDYKEWLRQNYHPAKRKY